MYSTCLLLCTGVFSDTLNLIFRDKSCSQFTSDGVKIVGNLDAAKIQQREDILAKCLQFLGMLARCSMYILMHGYKIKLHYSVYVRVM